MARGTIPTNVESRRLRLLPNGRYNTTVCPYRNWIGWDRLGNTYYIRELYQGRWSALAKAGETPYAANTLRTLGELLAESPKEV